MPKWEEQKPPWFDDKRSYSDQKFGIDAKTGKEYVEYRDGNGSHMRQRYEPDTDTLYKPQYFDPTTSTWRNPQPGVDIYQDASGRWWKEDEYLQILDDGEWRNPKEGEEPMGSTTWDRDYTDARRADPMPPDPTRPVDPNSPILEPPDTPRPDPPDRPPPQEWYRDQDGNWHETWRSADGSQNDRWTDQYGRRWHWTQDNEGDTKLGYTKDDIWHDVHQDNDVGPGFGNWIDRWTDKDGRRWETEQDTEGNVIRSGYTDQDGNYHDRNSLGGLLSDNLDLLDFGDWGKDNPEVAQDLANSMARDQAFGDLLRDNPEITQDLANKMARDQTAGELRDPEPGEIPFNRDLFDPNSSGPTLDPDLFDPNAPGPTLDPRLLIYRDGPTLDSSLLDPNAPGPTLDPALLDPNSPGPTLDPALLDPNAMYTMDLVYVEPDDPRLGTHPRYQVRDDVAEGPEAGGRPERGPEGEYTIPEIERPDLYQQPPPPPPVEELVTTEPGSATLDPALLDPMSPGPTVDPALLDPNSPGPTIDPNALDPNAPGETIDPNLLDPSAPGPTLDPAQLEAGLLEPSGVAEPAGVTDRGFTDPSLTQEPSPPEPGAAPRQDHLDDPLST